VAISAAMGSNGAVGGGTGCGAGVTTGAGGGVTATCGFGLGLQAANATQNPAAIILRSIIFNVFIFNVFTVFTPRNV